MPTLSAAHAWGQQAAGASELPSIEEVGAPTAREKIKGRLPKKGDVVLEVVLHSGSTGGKAVVTEFKKYLEKIGIEEALAVRACWNDRKVVLIVTRRRMRYFQDERGTP
jgi:hypothetical protein